MQQYRWTTAMEKLCESMSSAALNDLAVRLFVGSYTLPKSSPLAFKLLKVSIAVANTEQERLTAQYFEASLQRLESIETKQTNLFNLSSKTVTNLANAGHPLAQFTCGKELIQLSRAAENRENRETMQLQGSAYLLNCARQGFSPSFFYMGWLHEHGLEAIKNLKLAMEWYYFAASHNDPQAFFRLAQIAQEKKNEKKEIELLVQAAELGLVEAQHNLAMRYLEKGEHVKSLAWLMEAAGRGFYPSVTNLGMLLYRGGGEIVPNPMAAYPWLKLSQRRKATPEVDLAVLECERLFPEKSK